MARLKDFGVGMRHLEGRVRGSTGSFYTVNTDVNGVVSCSCLSWLYPKAKNGVKPPAIGERWCKHLESIKSGQVNLQPFAATVGPIPGVRADDAQFDTPVPATPAGAVKPKRRYGQ